MVVFCIGPFDYLSCEKVNAYLDGIQLPSYIVNSVDNALDIASVYKRIQYCIVSRFVLVIVRHGMLPMLKPNTL